MSDTFRKIDLTTGRGKSPYGEVVRIEGLDDLTKALKEVGLSVNGTIRKSLREGIKVIQEQAEANAKEITNRKATKIEASTHGSREGSKNVTMTLRISVRAFYLGFFESGVQPHEIPKHGGVVAFEGNEGLVVVRHVNHPGMAARPWLRPAFDARKDAAVQRVGDYLREAIETKRAANDAGE
jgi:HK97 gp10 family phage protein